ncbi:MAG: hypothetical protein K2Y27_21325 [Xanthobacteraceae bacterium]|nr:hypothetical protein [Xanthobacteraceae bacterium]
MRNVAVVLLSFSVSAFVTVACVSLVKTCNGAQAQQSAAPHDATRARPDGWKAVPAYEQDDVWPF